MSQFFKTHSEVSDWLDDKKIKDYTIHDDLSVSVKGDVIISNQNLILLPIQFNDIQGSFACQNNQLISLHGMPKKVDLIFNCSKNRLTSLEFAPICHSLFCSYNPIDIMDLIKNPYPLSFYSFQHIAKTEAEKLKGFESFYKPYIVRENNFFKIDLFKDNFDLILEKLKLDNILSISIDNKIIQYDEKKKTKL
jgi:hypothetical protein